MYRALASLLSLVFILGIAGTASAELVVHLKLDDGAGTVASDSSGNGYDSDISGDPEWATGYFGGALLFNGSDAVTLPAEEIGLRSTMGSVAFWMNTDVPSGINTMFWAGDNTTGGGFGGENEFHVHLESTNAGIWLGGELSFYADGTHIHSDPQKGAAGNSPSDPALMGDNEWHHVVATWSADDNSIKLFLDGTLLSEGAFGASDFDMSNIYLGQMANVSRTYSGHLDDVQIYDEALTDQGVQLAMGGGKKPGPATEPSPPDAAEDIRRDVILSWTPGPYAATHDVYVGTNFDDVNTAERDNPLDVLASEGQAAGTFSPVDPLAFGQTYYWRVDEVNAAPDDTIYRSDVWSFTTETLTSPVVNIAVTASTTSVAGKEPNNTVDGSGLTDGCHSIEELDMWVGDAAEGEPAWIQFDFDKIYKLKDMQVWNYNMQYEFIVGLGFKDVTIEYAVNTNDWMTLKDVELSRASGKPTYAGETVDLEGIGARAVRITIHSNRSAKSPSKFGLSEIRFNYIPTYAREPEPADGAIDISVDAVLGWRPGREATSHQVYFGHDEAAVAESNAPAHTTSDISFTPGPLDLDTTYFWKVNEVNEAATPAVWEGDLWSFSTPEYITVEDFESYTGEENNRVYEAWADGYNIGSNGSVVGHDDPPYVEETTVRSGSQSMPFYYGMEGATTSEATLTLNAVEDWTQAGGAQTLVLFVRGSLGNATGQLYFKVNDTRVDFPGSAGSLAAPIWKQWNIDLASLGNAARSVSKLTIGVSGSGTGLLYVDAIRLYRLVEPMVGPPVDPGTANLAAYYPMSNNANDASGNGRSGTAEVGSSFAQGPTGSGQAILLDGTSGYVDLPIGTLIQSLNSTTIATWLNWTGSGSWQRAFDFGSDTDVYMFLTPNSGDGTLRFAITTASSDGESTVEASPGLSTGWHHVAVTIDGVAGTMSLYLDGVLVDSETTETLPADLGNTTQNWLGRSQYAADAYFNGYIDEFRIYDRALSEAEVRYLIGDR